uniref:Sperm protein 6kDa n=1 Tax=Haliotis kamtschatkana TaxID=6457 RepID=M9WF04_HALKA|nr:sperm protein 6kDa [Haliotis kamtschatkana]
MRVILIVTAVFLIISLAKSVSSSSYDDDDEDEDDSDEEPKDLITKEVVEAMGGSESMFQRRKRSADSDYGGGYGNDDPDNYLESK